MIDVYNNFFFGCSKSDKNANSMARKGELTKKWAGLNIFYMLIDLWRSRFVYKLPETMDARFLELCFLYSNRSGVIDYKGEIINADVVAGNSWSRYGYFNNVQLIDFMGKSYGNFIPDCPGNIEPDCVLIYNNNYDVPPISRIRWYADRLTEIQGSINSCIVNLRGSVYISCTPEQKKAIEKAFKEASNGAPIYLSFDVQEGAYQLRPEVITAPQTGEILKQLLETYDKTISEFCTEYGIIANGIVNKLSGVGEEELKRNQQRTEIAFNQAFRSRQEGIEKIRKMFGLTENECDVMPGFSTDYGITHENTKEVTENVLDR